MTSTTYTKEELDLILASMYTQHEVDAFLAALQAQIDGVEHPPEPSVGKIIGVGGMTAFRGMKIGGNRIYNGFTGSRGYNPTSILAQVKADQLAGRKSYLSIDSGTKKGNSDPASQDWPSSLTGQPVDQFVPAVKVVKDAAGIIIIHHEPENDPGTSEHFRTWFGLASDYYKKQVPGIQIGLCLMGWTGRNGVANFAPWTPDPSKFDVLCPDNYATKIGDTAQAIFGNSLAHARQLKKPMMICETGMPNTIKQIPFLVTLDAFVQENADVQGFLWWNQGSFTMNADALTYFGTLVNSGRYAQSKLAV